MKHSVSIVGALLLMSAALPAAAAVTATLDRDHVDAGDPVQLTLQHDGHTSKDPDLDPLKKDFDVLGTSSGTSMQLTNGHFTSQVQLQITLAPKHDGSITIPSLQWDGEKSEPLQLAVGGGGSAHTAADNSPRVFIETSLDQPRPYVQGEATLTVRIYADQQLFQGDLEFSGNSDVAAQVLGKDQQHDEVRDGRHYLVIQRQYLLQPQRSGNLTLEGPVLDAQVAVAENRSPFGNDPFGGMMRSVRPLRVHGKPITLDVRPRPTAVTGGVWLPASEVALEESWKPDGLRVHVGEPLTRHLQLKAKGATGAQLPDLTALMNLPEGLKAYPDQAKLDTTAQSDTVLGTRDQDIALIAQQPGHYELPAVHLSWWDTKQDVQREAVLPARTIEILPAEGTSSGSTSSAPTPVSGPATMSPTIGLPAPQPAAATPPASALSSRLPWPWISLGLALLWLATLLAWWWQARRRRTLPAPAASSAPESVPDLKNVRAICRSNQPAEARRALLAWARQRWPDGSPLGLKELAARIDDATLATALQDLDRACYRGGDWHGEALALALGDIGARLARKGSSKSAADLAPLYP